MGTLALAISTMSLGFVLGSFLVPVTLEFVGRRKAQAEAAVAIAEVARLVEQERLLLTLVEDWGNRPDAGCEAKKIYAWAQAEVVGVLRGFGTWKRG